MLQAQAFDIIALYPEATQAVQCNKLRPAEQKGQIPDSQKPLQVRSLKMSKEVGIVNGFMDIPPYVTMVPPGANDLATAVDAEPPTQFRPSLGLGMSAEAAVTSSDDHDRYEVEFEQQICVACVCTCACFQLQQGHILTKSQCKRLLPRKQQFKEGTQSKSLYSF